MAPRRVALPVAALLVLAGCTGTGLSPPARQTNATETTVPETSFEPPDDPVTSGAPGETTAGDAPGDATATDPPGGTTAASNATTASDANTLPPGTNGSGVEDADALVTAHRTALNDTGFAFRFSANVSVGPSVQWTVQRGGVERGLSPLVVHSTSLRRLDDDTTEVRTDLWANATDVAVRYRGADEADRRRYNRSGEAVEAYDETWDHLPRADLDSQVTQTWLVELALTVGDFRLARTERRDGRLFATLRATESVAAANYTDLNATLTVDGQGRVHAAELAASAEGGDETRLRYEFELTDVGDVTVERPAWVEDAPRANATATEANESSAASGDPTTTGG
ncbi:hypothetical protein [Halorussus halobius]|uniref:hypothetical protein n=1 Tax=Halorussus halobius TaxID=1710537 RepID=UPI001091FCE6|nr:hypothetical protein [Halorussus halobius]